MHAPKERVWRAWTDPELLQKWWVSAPTVALIERVDPTAGGTFVTQMSEDGENFVPHTDGIFLLVEHESRIVFANASSSSWHPARPAPVGMTAEITSHRRAPRRSRTPLAARPVSIRRSH